MKKNVYSLVLMDDVIRAVDEEAYRRGTSRSNLINQILAEKLSCITPEMRMRDIFQSITEMINQDFQIQQQRSASLMTLRTALEYKYRPTINYKVELARSPSDYLGTLKVQIRTQSSALTELFNNFFLFWIETEKALLGGSYSCELSSGCFVRQLINSANNVDIGEAISSYITFLNNALKLYFSAPQSFPAAAQELRLEYARRLEHTII